MRAQREMAGQVKRSDRFLSHHFLCRFFPDDQNHGIIIWGNLPIRAESRHNQSMDDTPPEDRFLTSTYLEVQHSLMRAVIDRGYDLLPSPARDIQIGNCIAWLNAHALLKGIPDMIVSENSFAPRVQ